MTHSKAVSAHSRHLAQAAALLLLLATLLAGYFCFKPVPVPRESDIRIPFAGCCVMLFPGLLLGQLLGVRARGLFETLARAFSLSLVVHLVFALVLFQLRFSINHWAALLLAANFAATVVIIGYSGRFSNGLLTDLFRGWNRRELGGNLFLAATAGFLCWAMYRWGDRPDALGWEVGTHYCYMRQYVSGLPLDYSLCALRPDPDLVLPNLFFLWEFLLAGIAKISGADVLVAAPRSRWLVPLLGLAAFYFMAANAFRCRRRAQLATVMMAVIILMDFVFLAPSPLRDIGVGREFFRGVFAFWGSVHHSDAAMDIMLPLLVGFLFLYWHRPTFRHLLYLGAMLALSFFWHPREYFQVMWYGGVALIAAVLLLPFDFAALKALLLKRALPMSALFVLLAGSLLALSKYNLRDNKTIRGETDRKIHLLRSMADPAQTLTAAPLLHFKFHGAAEEKSTPKPLPFSYMALAIAGLPLLLAARSRRALWLAFYVLLLWWLTLCFRWSQALLEVLTYGEILMSQVRFLHLFCYLLLGLEIYYLFKICAWLRPQIRGSSAAGLVAVSLAACFIVGSIFAALWQAQGDDFTGLFSVLTTLAWMCAAAFFYLLRTGRRGWAFLAEGTPSAEQLRWPSPLLTALGCFFFLAPACWPQAQLLYKELSSTARALPQVNGDNPVGLSGDLIKFVKEQIPPRTRFLIDPLSRHYLGLFHPVYIAPYPAGYILSDLAEIETARNGKHPLFRTNDIDMDAVDAYIEKRKGQYILGTGVYGPQFQQWARDFPQRFELVFDSGHNEIILKILRPGA